MWIVWRRNLISLPNGRELVFLPYTPALSVCVAVEKLLTITTIYACVARKD